MSQSRVICLEGTQLPARELIGGKAWSIGRMLSLGLRVPPAFVLPVSECSKYHEGGAVLEDEVWAGVLDGIAYLESMTGRKFGDPQAPLLVSVRSGAAISMPGMMDTVLNLGVTDGVEVGLANLTGNAEYALDTHARFCHQYGDVVLKADLELPPQPANWDQRPFSHRISKSRAISPAKVLWWFKRVLLATLPVRS